VKLQSFASPTDASQGAREADGDIASPGADAARLLADLAAAGVGAADPHTWYAASPPSSDGALWSDDAVVTVSPSKVETVSTCALRWMFVAAGGVGADTSAQSLGTLVHAVAQALPTGTLAQLRAELDRLWPGLGLKPGWPARSERERAERMVGKLASYVADAGQPLAIEAPFDVTVGRARLRGKVDRVEDAGAGAGIVVDLKTGKTPPSKEKTLTNPQLGAYQLALDAGAIPGATASAGARLVYVGSDSVGPVLRDQPRIAAEADGTNWARTMVEAAADTMASAQFLAQVNDQCPTCPVRTSCPVRPEGRRVIA
jgi:RecB family exonuclease